MSPAVRKCCPVPPGTPGVATVTADSPRVYWETAGEAGDLKFGPTTHALAKSGVASAKIDRRFEGTLSHLQERCGKGRIETVLHHAKRSAFKEMGAEANYIGVMIAESPAAA